MKLLINFSTIIHRKTITIIWKEKYGTSVIHSILLILSLFVVTGKLGDSLVKFSDVNIIHQPQTKIQNNAIVFKTEMQTKTNQSKQAVKLLRHRVSLLFFVILWQMVLTKNDCLRRMVTLGFFTSQEQVLTISIRKQYQSSSSSQITQLRMQGLIMLQLTYRKRLQTTYSY